MALTRSGLGLPGSVTRVVAMGFALAQASLGGACDIFVSRPGLGGTATPACAQPGRAARALRPLPGESSAASAPEGLGGLARPWAAQHISLQACTGWQVRHAGGRADGLSPLGCLVGHVWIATVGDQQPGSAAVCCAGGRNQCNAIVKELKWPGGGCCCALGVFGRALGARVHEQQHGIPLGACAASAFSTACICFALLRGASRVPAARSQAAPGASGVMSMCAAPSLWKFPTSHYCLRYCAGSPGLPPRAAIGVLLATCVMSPDPQAACLARALARFMGPCFSSCCGAAA